MDEAALLSTPPAAVVACRECDLLQREVSLPPGGAAKCRRCGATLYRNTRDSIDHTLAYVLAAAILYLVANIYPIVGLDVQGTRTTTTLPGAVRALWLQDMHIVAVLVFVTTILAPAVQLAGTIYILVSLKLRRALTGMAVSFRAVETVQPWNMVEVFMLGILVSLIKVSDFATIIQGVALWSFAGVTILMTAAAAAFNSRDVWARADRALHAGGGA